MQRYLLPSVLFVNLAMCSSVFAAHNVSITGTIPTTVHLNQNNGFQGAAQPTLNISLERITLSPQAKKFLADNVDKMQTTTTPIPKDTLPTTYDLGMGKVPVLNQGQHGTCVTFAVSGAVDAAYNDSDYVSELCNLELGSYLAKQDSNYLSGWDGTYPIMVLQQMEKYGIINTAYQLKYGCGNSKRVVKHYPTNNESNTGVPMSDTDFQSHSEPVLKSVSYKVLMTDEDTFSKAIDKDELLNNVKTSIASGHRVTFGTLLDVSDSLEYYNGAMGKVNGTSHDAWILTDKIRADIKHDRDFPNDEPKINAGHAMIIVAYDDNATIDEPGSNHPPQKGVLTLRNSWSREAGDKGNYYMSYDYFKAFVMDAQEIIPQQ